MESKRRSSGYSRSGDPIREEHVRTRKECDQAKKTHWLETLSRETGQNTERMRKSERDPLAGNRIERGKVGHKKVVIEQGELTIWRPH